MRPPYKFEAPTPDGDRIAVTAFDENHTVSDVLRWLLTEGYDAEDLKGMLESQ